MNSGEGNLAISCAELSDEKCLSNRHRNTSFGERFEGVDLTTESLRDIHASVPGMRVHRIVLGIVALILACGCQLAKHIERNTEAIEENRRTVEKSTQTIRNNASAIDESTSTIVANGNTVKDASQAIAANAVAVKQSTIGIEANRLIIEESTRAIDKNKAAIESNIRAIRENERIVRDSTAAITKNATVLQKVAVVLEAIDANRRLFAFVVFIALILLVGPSILMLMTLRRTERVLNSVLRAYRVSTDPPEKPL